MSGDRWRRWLLLVSVVIVGSSQTWATPQQWSGNGHWYDYVPAPGISYEAAKAGAESLGWYLASLTSAEENEFVTAFIIPPSEQVPSPREAYIGAYQDLTAPDYAEPAGGWRWETGEDWSWTNWAGGGPNNASGVEHCAAIYVDDSVRGQWNDTYGGGNQYKLGYVIEIPEPATLWFLSLAGLVWMRPR